MKTIAPVFIVFFFFCAPVTKPAKEISYSLVEKGPRQRFIRAIENLDSLICIYIDETKGLQMHRDAFNDLSPLQQEEISRCARYGGTTLDFYTDDSEKEQAHPNRMNFSLYDTYFDKLGAGDLALEIVVKNSSYNGNRYFYLIHGNDKDSSYSVSYLIGTIRL